MEQKPLLLRSRFGERFANDVFHYIQEKYDGLFELGDVEITAFPNKEILPKIGPNVRRRRVYLVHAFEGLGPVGSPYDNYDPNFGWMALYLINDAALRASAERVTNVLPHIPYQRQDRKEEGRVPIGGKGVVKLLECAGGTSFERIVTVEMHSGQQAGFIEHPYDNLYTNRLFAGYLRSLGKDFAVVSPDPGGGNRARALAAMLGTHAVYSEKVKRGQEKIDVQIKGSLEGKIPVIIDDMVDSGSTLALTARKLREGGEFGGGGPGAEEVYACATHALLSPKDGRAEDRLRKLMKLVVTDTIPMSDAYRASQEGWMTVLPVAPLVGDALYQIETAGSVSSLFTSPGT
ncbi:MAG: ribose-phosphate pyrophosphokinase [Candidatus Aenigmarchaeota archaeon]|nr:ribose-phosphate pyrophosphokinase [Candidatus Aenigmarchaeota archaeon]